jgi:hypothetical protein
MHALLRQLHKPMPLEDRTKGLFKKSAGECEFCNPFGNYRHIQDRSCAASPGAPMRAGRFGHNDPHTRDLRRRRRRWRTGCGLSGRPAIYPREGSPSTCAACRAPGPARSYRQARSELLPGFVPRWRAPQSGVFLIPIWQAATARRRAWRSVRSAPLKLSARRVSVPLVS